MPASLVARARGHRRHHGLLFRWRRRLGRRDVLIERRWHGRRLVFVFVERVFVEQRRCGRCGLIVFRWRRRHRGRGRRRELPGASVERSHDDLGRLQRGPRPTRNGGDLLWAKSMVYYPPSNPCQQGCPSIQTFAVGPTGDFALGSFCYLLGSASFDAGRFNASGVAVGTSHDGCSTSGGWKAEVGFTRHNDLVMYASALILPGTFTSLQVDGASSVHWNATWNGGPPIQPSWDADGLGDLFAVVQTNEAMSLDSTLALPAPPGSPFPVTMSYLVRGGAMGESYQADFKGSFIPDETGGVYRFDALPAALDLGCGPMVPSSASDTYLARFDSAWSCTYARVLPAAVNVIADGSGGVILTAGSTTGLDLGCGVLPVAPGGSTFITHLDSAGNCVSGNSLPAPNLTVALVSTGRLLVSGLVGPAPVDLGGGALMPLGAQDFVLGMFDAAGNHIWSRRFGGVGASFTSPRVSTSASGDVYLLTGMSGAVDLGGGPITGTPTVVASYSPSGAHRWSRAFHIGGTYKANIDGCGALVVMSTDDDFDPGCGKLIPPASTYPYGCAYNWPHPNVAIARFQP